MLQNPKTKFSYARRVLALPMLFTLVFVFIIKAKNKEIEKVNRAISKVEINEKKSAPDVPANTVSTKKDTLKPLAKAVDTVKSAQKTISKITPGTGDLEAQNAAEEAQKAAEEAQITAKRAQKDADEAQNAAKAVREAQSVTNSKEFKEMMRNAKNAAEAGKAAASALAYTNSAEFKSAVAQAKATQTDGNTVIVNGKNGYTTKTTTVTTTGIDDDDFDKIRINGRPATLAELHRLDSSKIVWTNINSKITNGKKYKTVEVTTK